MAVVMVLGVAVGSTMAWLTSGTDPVVNTFTVGDINISLEETGTTLENNENKKNFDFVPGDALAKDPKVTVIANSEKCYLFLKVTEAYNTYTDLSGKIINWNIRELDNDAPLDGNNGWVAYTPENNITVPSGTYYYYRVVEKSNEAQSWYVLAGDANHTDECATNQSQTAICNCTVNGKVTVNTGVTKEMRTNESGTGISQTKPTLTFMAAAVQFDNIANVHAAFAETPAGFKPAP